MMIPNTSRAAIIRVYDSAGNVIETHEHAGDFKEPESLLHLMPTAVLSGPTDLLLYYSQHSGSC